MSETSKPTASRWFAVALALANVLVAGAISWLVANGTQRADLGAQDAAVRREAYQRLIAEAGRVIAFTSGEYLSIPEEVESWSEGLRLFSSRWAPIEAEFRLTVAQVKIVGSADAGALADELEATVGKLGSTLIRPPGPSSDTRACAGEECPSTTSTTLSRDGQVLRLGYDLLNIEARNSLRPKIEQLRSDLVELARHEVGF
jgi:hypothetical protein